MSWSDEGVPPIADRSMMRRRISEAGDQIWHRQEQPIVMDRPENIRRAIEQVRWLPGAYEPDIKVTGEEKRPTVTVRGVREVEYNWANDYVELEVDTQVYEKPDGGASLRYYLRFPSILSANVTQPVSVRIRATEGAYGGGVASPGERLYVASNEDSYRCTADWRDMGEEPHRKYGWNVDCYHMEPDEWYDHNPTFAKTIAPRGEWPHRKPISEVTRDEAEMALIDRMNEMKRCRL